MNRSLKLRSLHIAFLLGAGTFGCSQQSTQTQQINSQGTRENHTSIGKPQPRSKPITDPINKPVTLRGTIVHKQWSKTMESWDAGGSDYYILEIVDKPSIILRPSEQITFADFGEFAGKRVEIVGRLVERQPWRPNDLEQYPEGETTRGVGFRVEQVSELEP